MLDVMHFLVFANPINDGKQNSSPSILLFWKTKVSCETSCKFSLFLKLCWDSSFASRGLNVEDVSGGNPFWGVDKGGESKTQVLAGFLT